MSVDSLRWKRQLGTLLSLRRSRRPRRLVLLYHAVGTGPWALDPAGFRAQMLWLSAQARVYSLDDLLASSAERPLQVALTFDDGYASLVDIALPILAELGLTATVYLNTAWIGDGLRRPSDPRLGHYPGETFLSWSDVGRLFAAGWMIGSHGVEHLDLTNTAPAMTDRELLDSRHTIGSRLGTDCRHFSYTWGRHTESLRRRVDAAGYRFAAAAHHAALSPDDDLLMFPRVNIDRNYSLDDFKAIVRGDWDYLGWIQRARAWRR